MTTRIANHIYHPIWTASASNEAASTEIPWILRAHRIMLSIDGASSAVSHIVEGEINAK